MSTKNNIDKKEKNADVEVAQAQADALAMLEAAGCKLEGLDLQDAAKALSVVKGPYLIGPLGVVTFAVEKPKPKAVKIATLIVSGYLRRSLSSWTQAAFARDVVDAVRKAKTADAAYGIADTICAGNSSEAKQLVADVVLNGSQLGSAPASVSEVNGMDALREAGLI